MTRFGPVGERMPHSNKKVCLAATDRRFFVNLLYDLSLRDDCYYVKYSTHPRDGMYLGRCFMRTDQAAAQLCQDLKRHPKLLVTIQDDDFFSAFRDS